MTSPRAPQALPVDPAQDAPPRDAEAATTPADSLAGGRAKAELCQSPVACGCADYGYVLSAVDDAFRLLAAGGSS